VCGDTRRRPGHAFSRWRNGILGLTLAAPLHLQLLLLLDQRLQCLKIVHFRPGLVIEQGLADSTCCCSTGISRSILLIIAALVARSASFCAC